MVATMPWSDPLTSQPCALGGAGRRGDSGNRRGTNGGSGLFLRLPNTGLALDRPIYGSPLHPERPGRGIEPDLAGAPTAADYAAGRDAVISAVLGRIQALRGLK